MYLPPYCFNLPFLSHLHSKCCFSNSQPLYSALCCRQLFLMCSKGHSSYICIYPPKWSFTWAFPSLTHPWFTSVHFHLHFPPQFTPSTFLFNILKALAAIQLLHQSYLLFVHPCQWSSDIIYLNSLTCTPALYLTTLILENKLWHVQYKLSSSLLKVSKLCHQCYHLLKPYSFWRTSLGMFSIRCWAAMTACGHPAYSWSHSLA